MTDLLTCDYCGEFGALRVTTEGIPGLVEPTLCCIECFTTTDTGPCWDDCPEAKQTLEQYNATPAWAIWVMPKGRCRVLLATNGEPSRGSMRAEHPSISAAQAWCRAQTLRYNIWLEGSGGVFNRIYNSMLGS